MIRQEYREEQDENTSEEEESEEATTENNDTVHGSDEEAQPQDGGVSVTTTLEGPDGRVMTATVRWGEGYAMII